MPSVEIRVKGRNRRRGWPSGAVRAAGEAAGLLLSHCSQPPSSGASHAENNRSGRGTLAVAALGDEGWEPKNNRPAAGW